MPSSQYAAQKIANLVGGYETTIMTLIDQCEAMEKERDEAKKRCAELEKELAELKAAKPLTNGHDKAVKTDGP